MKRLGLLLIFLTLAAQGLKAQDTLILKYARPERVLSDFRRPAFRYRDAGFRKSKGARHGRGSGQ